MKLIRQRTIWWPTWQGWVLLFLLAVGSLALLIANLHDFLAVTERVADADSLAVEAWVPEKVARVAAEEFKNNGYRSFLVTGFNDTRDHARMSAAVQRLVSYGIPRDRVIVCTGSPVDEYRSFAMARALRDAVKQGTVITRGVNIVAPAAHARKTWLAYSRALGAEISVGIIAVLPGDYEPKRWWQSSQGVKWVVANGAGWLHELITGPRL